MVEFGSLYREELIDGSLYTAGYSGRASAKVSLQAYPCSFSMEVNGSDLRGTWAQTALTQQMLEDGGVHTVQTLQSDMGGILVRIHTELDPPAADGAAHSLQRYLEITNLHNNAQSLTRVQVFGGGLFNHNHSAHADGTPLYRILYMRNGSPCTEGDFCGETIPAGELCISKRSYDERYRTPFAVVQDTLNGDTAVLHLGFSGGFRFAFHNFYLNGPTNCSNLSFSLQVGTTSPVRVLDIGETVTTPIAHLTYIHGGLDEALQHSHTHIRRFSAPYEKHYAVECATMTKEEADVQKTLVIAEQMGAEIFYIDAGWYIPKSGDINLWFTYTGDWEREADTYDSSLDEIRERCHSMGMKFGLWMDVEKIGVNSGIFKSGKLRCLTGYDGKLCGDDGGTEPTGAYMTDLTDPDTAEWVYRSICHVIERYQLDYFRLDSGLFTGDAQHTIHGIRESVDWRYYDTMYAILKKLRKKYPNVIFQNCAGGGMRLDLGIVPIFSNTWISDQNRAPDSFRIINGVSMQLPTEYCVKVINGMGAELSGSDYFKLNAARFGSPLIPICMDDPLFCQRTARMLDMYRRYIRPMLPTCLTWHHTPEVSLDVPGSRGILEISSPDASCAMIAAFTLGEVLDARLRLPMLGVRADKQYRVWANDELLGDYSGEQLREGLDVQIAEKYDSVCLIAVESETPD